MTLLSSARRLLRHDVRSRLLRQRHLTTVGIRREDPSRIWERRAPLTPLAVSDLLQNRGRDPVRVEVESCGRRCFQDAQYEAAGADIVPSLSGKVDLILGIKEPPVSEVYRVLESEKRKRTWMVFSHTHKGQEYNTPLLAAFLDPERTQTLIDHELLAAPSGSRGEAKRVAAFGWFAGAVGAGEALSMTGLALLRQGSATSLLHLPRPYTFATLAEFRQALARTGECIRTAPLTQTEGPIVIGLTGAGNVADGAKAMLDVLGTKWTAWHELSNLRNDAGNQNQIYACAIPSSAYFTRVDGSPYSREDYYATPERYRSVFAHLIAPYLTTLINGAGWRSGYPRIMSMQDLESASPSESRIPKLVAVQDITCDIKGNLEFIDRHTTIDSPHYVGSGGLLISAIDILPTELPADASEHFSTCILPYVRQLVQPDRLGGETVKSLERATIVESGELTGPHNRLQPLVDTFRSQSLHKVSVTSGRPAIPRRKKVLLLGCGLVAGPAVEVFAARPDLQLMIASNSSAEAFALLKDRPNAASILLDVQDSVALGEAVSAADVVVSLLPAPMHPQVAKHCIAKAKHLVTASYISPELAALDQAAKEKDILLLGECGLDPGIDSMAAMRILDRVKREQKRVSSFVSWCGGLPEPPASNVPLGYKFSWSPRAVLAAALNSARYKLNGSVQEVSGGNVLASHFPSVPLWKALALEGLANRDSLPYAEEYGLGPVDHLTDLFRGTLRYQGFSRLLDSFRRLGLLDTEPVSSTPADWEDVMRSSVGKALGSSTAPQRADLESAITDLLGIDLAQETTEALRWLSILPDPRRGTASSLIGMRKAAAPIDLFAQHLSMKLTYAPHERDTVLLHHSFQLIDPSFGSAPKQSVTASLYCTGTGEASAMATTVGKTLAFAALRVLDGDIKGRGVKGPYEREVWEGVLERLDEAGVSVVEKWS